MFMPSKRKKHIVKTVYIEFDRDIENGFAERITEISNSRNRSVKREVVRALLAHFDPNGDR